MHRLRDWLRLWLTVDHTVGRREYLLSGIALTVVKYAGDLLLVWRATGHVWHPLDYLSPVSSLASHRLAGAPPSLLPILALWSLPFLWIGVSMSMRRALDAGPRPHEDRLLTAWEPGQRLSLDVRSQPRPLHEWSPYTDIAPPHLDGYFRSRRGEFASCRCPAGARGWRGAPGTRCGSSRKPTGSCSAMP